MAQLGGLGGTRAENQGRDPKQHLTSRLRTICCLTELVLNPTAAQNPVPTSRTHICWLVSGLLLILSESEGRKENHRVRNPDQVPTRTDERVQNQQNLKNDSES